MIEELNSTNSSNTKKEILARYPELQKVIEYTYNPFKMYGVTSEAIKKSSFYLSSTRGYVGYMEEYLYELLDLLSSRKLTGHEAYQVVLNYTSNFPEYEEEIFRVLDKDLKCRLGVSEINKVFPSLIPVFDVALADSSKDYSKVDENYYISHKLDGLKCIAIYKDSDVRFYSRTGKEFFTLDVIKRNILDTIKGTHLETYNWILDGELCIIDENGQENFQAILSEYSKKNHTIENPMYILYDMVPYEEFVKGAGTELYEERYQNMLKNFNDTTNNPNIKVLEQYRYTKEKFEEMMEISRKEDWEGLILRLNTFYKKGRSKNMLKVKEFEEDEYVVTGVVNEVQRFINKTTGLEESLELLSSVTIDHKGYEVNIGSGFSEAQRRYYYSNPSEIIGKVITVKHFGESKDRYGKLSLKWGTLKCIHGDVRLV